MIVFFVLTIFSHGPWYYLDTSTIDIVGFSKDTRLRLNKTKTLVSAREVMAKKIFNKSFKV